MLGDDLVPYCCCVIAKQLSDSPFQLLTDILVKHVGSYLQVLSVWNLYLYSWSKPLQCFSFISLWHDIPK